jgi:hypothetical protein
MAFDNQGFTVRLAMRGEDGSADDKKESAHSQVAFSGSPNMCHRCGMCVCVQQCEERRTKIVRVSASHALLSVRSDASTELLFAALSKPMAFSLGVAALSPLFPQVRPVVADWPHAL